MRLVLLAAVVVLGLFASGRTSIAGANTYTVDSTADAVDADLSDPACLTVEGACTVRAAFMQANALTGPATINIPAGTYTISIPDGAETNFADRGDFDVVTDIEVVGAGSTTPASANGGTIIDAAGLDRVFHVDIGDSLSLTGMTLRNGAGDVSGGAILAGFGNPTGATLVLDDVIVEDSSSDNGGGVTVNGKLTATNSTFQRNETPGEGGGLFYIGSGTGHLLHMDEVQFLDNNAGLYGGLSVNGPATLDELTVTGNEATGAGGGIGAFGNVAIANSTIHDNHVTMLTDFTGHGGGIYTANSTLSITGSTINDNTAAGRGGGLMVIEQVDGRANVTIGNTTFDGNNAELGGGAFRMGNGDYGGGHMTVTNSTLSNNTAGSGGGIYNFGPDTSVLNMTNVTLSGNSAEGDGGAIRTIGESGETHFDHATITDNRADSDGDQDGSGGGINQDDGTLVTLRNSILIDNRDNADRDSNNCSGTIELQSENLVGETGGCTMTGASALTGDADLEPLADNGGPTRTHALGVSSMARDTADGCPPPATDQRGEPRPSGPECDLGAFEVQPPATPTPSPTPSPAPGDDRIWGNVDCDEGLTTRDNQAELRFVLQQNPLGQTEPCPDIGPTVITDGTQRIWGDEDCDGAVTTRDNQSKLRFVLQQNPLGQTEPCPDVGSTVVVTTPS